MTHARTQARAAIVALLKADPAITAARFSVYSSRLSAIPQSKVPCVNVHITGETVDDVSQESAPWRLEREASVSVEVTVWDADERIADTLDAAVELVENALLRDSTLGDTVGWLHLKSTEFAFDVDGNVPMGTASLGLSAYYDSVFPAEGTSALPDFDVAHVVWNLENEQAATERTRDDIEGIHE